MKIILSGVKPTGIPTLGNYLGAFKTFAALQKEMPEYEIFMFVADLHAVTIPQEPEELRKNIENVAALYLACGLEPDRLTLFLQSEVPEHAELGYIMQSLAYTGELERMTQYKDKVVKKESNITSALFTYPTLMAADILLYDAAYVPIGEDQKQHLELARDLAVRFNNRFGETFVVPEGLITETGARIMDLQDPQKKMSKSNDTGRGCIYLLDSPKDVKRKIKSAVTDNFARVHYDREKQPGISNLMTIYSALTGKSYSEIEALYEGKGYGPFKNDLSEITAGTIVEIGKRYDYFLRSDEMKRLLDEGREKAKKTANKKIREVYHKMGLGRF